MTKKIMDTDRPAILAPAGDRQSFLAALAAGADAVYCGLKIFSARMESQNFSFEELAVLTKLAHSKGVKVFVALNSLLKPGELEKAGRLVDRLKNMVRPDALIIQDLAFVEIARQAGFEGELHLSTLANMSFGKGLAAVPENSGITRVVLPRELDIDEIKRIADSCPDGLDLEVFIHGALCYAVSGRCYWSSFFGGKSGLRGRCVQPCRRVYEQKGRDKRFFSCQDFSVDVLVKILKDIPKVKTWKIEGRKKGPHYVYYTVKAYQLLRDHGADPQKKKEAVGLLERALGRPSTHYNFLPQRPQNPVRTDMQTGSGLMMGKFKGGDRSSYLVPREELLAGDLLRIGYEDDPFHCIHRVTKNTPKKGKLFIKIPSKRIPASGTPVFLIDRRERELSDYIRSVEKELETMPVSRSKPSEFKVKLPGKNRRKNNLQDMEVRRKPGRGKLGFSNGVWLSEASFEAVPKPGVKKCWWWLPPVIWPKDEESWKALVESLLKRGARHFVLNAPWQISLFDEKRGLNLWAGPFCNQANGLSVRILEKAGFSGVIVSPELGSDDYLELAGQSPLPLGIVIGGFWPLAVSRVLSDDLKTRQMFTSPRGEKAWADKKGADYWIYPNWKLDIRSKYKELQKAGYSLFVTLDEPLPGGIDLKKRKGLWNWDLKLL